MQRFPIRFESSSRDVSTPPEPFPIRIPQPFYIQTAKRFDVKHRERLVQKLDGDSICIHRIVFHLDVAMDRVPKSLEPHLHNLRGVKHSNE